VSLESSADRLAMLTELGEQVTLEHTASQEDWDTYAIVDQEFLESLDIDTSTPVALCREYDIYRASVTSRDDAGRSTAANRANTINTNRGAFNVINWRPDGTGMAILILETG